MTIDQNRYETVFSFIKNNILTFIFDLVCKKTTRSDRFVYLNFLPLQNEAVIFGDHSKSQFSQIYFGPKKIFHTQTIVVCGKEKRKKNLDHIHWIIVFVYKTY
jgi:hypothetical protein